MKSVSRSTVVITRLFANRCDQFLGVRSTMKGPDAISSHEGGDAELRNPLDVDPTIAIC